MFKYLLLLTSILFLVTALPQLATPLDLLTSKMSSADEANLPSMHPAAYYKYAKQLFNEGRKDDAVFWFYVGQLRYRFFLTANPTIAEARYQAPFSALNATIGEEINEYAGGNTTTWVAAIDRALAWDLTSPNYFTSKEHFHKEYIAIRNGLVELKKFIQSHAQEIKAQRAKSGLPNR